MRWFESKGGIENPDVGETRHVRRFLWLPKKLQAETRWLEFAVWSQEYTYTRYHDVGGHRVWLHSSLKWVDRGWVYVPPPPKMSMTGLL